MKLGFLCSVENPVVDGWLCEPRLCWIPPAYQKGLMRMGCTSVTSRDRAIKLDFSQLRFGEDWWKCCEELTQMASVDGQSNST
jgi:hypothetical protein